MNSKIGTVPNGSMANLDSGGPTYRLFGGTWLPVQPKVVGPITTNGAYLTPGAEAVIFSAAIPPGYIMATHFVNLAWTGISANPIYQVRIMHGNGTFLVGQYEGRDWTGGTQVLPHTFYAANGCLQTGEQAVVILKNITSSGIDLNVNSNGYYTNYFMVLYPAGV